MLRVHSGSLHGVRERFGALKIQMMHSGLLECFAENVVAAPDDRLEVNGVLMGRHQELRELQEDPGAFHDLQKDPAAIRDRLARWVEGVDMTGMDGLGILRALRAGVSDSGRNLPWEDTALFQQGAEDHTAPLPKIQAWLLDVIRNAPLRATPTANMIAFDLDTKHPQ